MTTQGEPQVKYTYRFRLQAKEPEVRSSDHSWNAELEAYINEILGIKKGKTRENSWNTP